MQGKATDIIGAAVLDRFPDFTHSHAHWVDRRITDIAVLGNTSSDSLIP